MANIPKTSVSLLRAIAEDPDSHRWEDFYERYQPLMSAYLSAAFPSLEADDVIQDALIAFMERAPNYMYDPQLKGLFHNYLIGILKFKAIEALKRRRKEAEKCESFKGELESAADEDREKEEREQAAWRKSVCEMAIRELMSDKSISTQNKEIFRRVAIQGEAPAYVAEAFGIERNNVDQIKARMTKKLKDIIIKMGCLNGRDD